MKNEKIFEEKSLVRLAPDWGWNDQSNNFHYFYEHIDSVQIIAWSYCDTVYQLTHISDMILILTMM